MEETSMEENMHIERDIEHLHDFSNTINNELHHNPYMMHSGLSSMWEHAVPMRMPWSAVHSSFPMRFSAINAMFPSSFSSPLSAYTKTSDIPSCSKRLGRPKRRATSEHSSNSDAPPLKEFISEEKMAERMSALRINHNTVLPSSQATLQEIDSRLMSDEDEEMGNNKSEGKKGTVIELSHHIKDLTKIKSDILPKRIMEHLYRPCLEVVLWRPPGGIIVQAIKEILESTSDDSNTSKMISSLNMDTGSDISGQMSNISSSSTQGLPESIDLWDNDNGGDNDAGDDDDTMEL